MLERKARQVRWAVAVVGGVDAIACVWLLILADDRANAGLVRDIGDTAGFAVVFSGVLWLQWFGALFEPYAERGLSRFDGWSRIGWIIPVASSVVPKMLVNDVWWQSDRSNPRSPVPSLIQVWWGLWLSAGLLKLYAGWADLNPPVSSYLEALYVGLLAVCAPFAIATVTLLTGRQAWWLAGDGTNANVETLPQS